jgi:mannonate dehydratase
MRVAIGLPDKATDEHYVLAKQLGCDGVVLATPELPGDRRWEHDDLARLRERVGSFGLRIEAIQNTPGSFIDPIRLGLPDRDRAIEDYQHTVRNLGRADIPVLTHNGRPNRLYRTGTRPGRGGAEVTTFDLDQARDLPLSHGRAYRADELWETYERFLRAVLPVAEEAGVRLALHPDDPPGPAIGGVERIFSSFEGFDRAASMAASPAWGLLFCTGCWSEMGGTDYVLRGIRHFGQRGQIVYVHFRDVQGIGDRFSECFIGEGQLDLTAVLRALREVRFDGPLIDDHTPRMVGDAGWSPRGRAYQTGYIQGMLRALDDLALAGVLQ